MDKKILAALAMVVVLGAGLRLAFLNWEPATYDEVALILSAKEYMKGNWLHNFVAFDTPPLTKYFLVISFSLAGYSEIALRIFSALLGIGTVILTFYIARKMYGDKTALVSATLLSFSILHLAFSRYAEHLIPVGFFYLLALWLIYDYAENGNRKNFILLGAAVALGVMAKFVMLYFIVTAVVYLLIKRKIAFRIKPAFSVSIDNYLLKAAAVFVVVLLLLWPFFLYPVSVNTSVVIDNSRQRNVSLSVPEGLLAFGEVSRAAATEQKTADITGYPLGYIWLFMIKEPLLFVGLFFAGIYLMMKERKKQDNFLLLSLFVFLIMLWVQNWGHTYRYFAVFLPAMAIIASRWVDKIKKYFWHAFIAVAVIMASFALYAFPNYVLYYNNLNDISKINLETHFSEGLGEAMNEVRNCSLTYTDRGNEYMVGFNFGYDKVTSGLDKKPDCMLRGMASYVDPTFNLSYADKCTAIKNITSEKFNRTLFTVYRC
jgi:4-amino-4-deoxy-L-arabinose transferase-like glycosyltransferase